MISQMSFSVKATLPLYSLLLKTEIPGILWVVLMFITKMEHLNSVAISRTNHLRANLLQGLLQDFHNYSQDYDASLIKREGWPKIPHSRLAAVQRKLSLNKAKPPLGLNGSILYTAEKCTEYCCSLREFPKGLLDKGPLPKVAPMEDSAA